MTLVKAKLRNVSDPAGPAIEVMFNPTDYAIDHAASYASMPVPGLQTPILQFIRGDADLLTLELFLDGTRQRDPTVVRDGLAALRRFVVIEGALHAPPVCRFEWQDLQFVGVVTSLKERFTLFDPSGAALRVRVSLTLRAYKSADVQLRELRRSSPDRTHVRVLREGETLAQIAAAVYGDPRLWRVIARANNLDRVRFIPPGTALTIPAV